MKLTKRRVTVGLISTAVVLTMTSVTTWALAETNAKPATPAKAVRLIVGYKDGASPVAAEAKMSALGARKATVGAGQQALSTLDATTVEVPAAQSASAIASLRSDPNVEYVEVDRVMKAFETTPNDPIYDRQPEMREVGANLAWDTTTGTAVTVAVIDTGVTATGDLAGVTVAGYDFVNNDASPTDDEGHGTNVASLIAARGNNATGMAGICWSCRIMPVKVLDANGEGYISDIAKGITWAVQKGAKVINLSLGGPASSKALSDAVAYANMNSVLVVAAAGNGTGTTPQYPAAHTDVVSVGATARCPAFGTDPLCTTGTNVLDTYSARNSSSSRWVDLAAPGNVVTMDRNGNYNTGTTGTSFASPIVAGIAALVKSHRPDYTGWELMNALNQSAAGRPVAGTNYGKVDAADALGIGTETVAPTASGISPAQGSYVKGTFPVKPLNIADNFSGIRNVTLYVDGVYKGFSRTAPYWVNWNSAGRNGTVRLQLRIYDKAGNFKFLDRAVVADNTPPTVKITKAPKSGSKVKGTVKVSFTGSDKYGVKLYQLIVDGKVRQSRTNASAPFTFNGNAYGSSMTVQIRAYDKANNVRYSTKYTYRH